MGYIMPWKGLFSITINKSLDEYLRYTVGVLVTTINNNIVALASYRQYPWELLNIPRRKINTNKNTSKDLCSGTEIENSFPANWSVLNRGLLCWPCKFVNITFLYSVSFLRSIHTAKANSFSALSYWDCCFRGYCPNCFLDEPSSRRRGTLLLSIAQEEHKFLQQTPSVHWWDNMRTYFWSNKGQAGEIISEKNKKSIIVKMSYRIIIMIVEMHRLLTLKRSIFMDGCHREMSRRIKQFTVLW